MAIPTIGQRKWNLLTLFGALTTVCFGFSGFDFAQSRQEPLRTVRERAGQALSVSASGVGNFPLAPQEKKLMGIISSAGKEGKWTTAKSLFSNYTGVAPPVFSAVLHAAFRCRQYREGAKVYQQCRKRCKKVHAPVYVQALRIFGKLREDGVVRQVWAEALEECEFSSVLASARIAAAADAGDPETAEKVLDLMEKKEISIDVHHMSSAIRACWGWGKNRHKAAKYFFDLCPQVGVTPNLIVFTNLIGAYDSASLEDIASAYQAMKKLEVVADPAFAETYLVSVLSKPKDLKLRTPAFAAKWLNDKSVDRLRAAQEGLSDFEKDGVKLTALSKTLKDALKKLDF